MVLFVYHIVIVCFLFVLCGVKLPAQTGGSISIDPICCTDERVQIFAGETQRTPEVLFRIVAGKYAVYDLTRTVILPSDANFSISNVRFRTSRSATAGNDCRLTDNTSGEAGNCGALSRMDNSFHHAIGNAYLLPEQTTVWVSVDMDVTGLSRGSGTIVIECTVQDYSF